VFDVVNGPCPENCEHRVKEEEPKVTEEGKGINEINVKGMWEVIPVKLDSGAFDWVFNPKSAQAFKLEETESSKAGLNFTAANGSEIKNYGQRTLKGYSGDNVPVEAPVQVAEVKRNLASAMRIMKAGNRIVLDDEGSYIEDKATGRKIKIRTEQGEFEFEIWVPKAKDANLPVKKDKKTKSNGNRFQALADMDVDSDSDNMLEMVPI
jgi:hypothetical protein